MKVKTQSKKVNKAWLNDHVNDTYVKLAHKEGYRARAAYKLKEIDEELRFHVQMETEKNIKLGMSPQDARLKALRSFGPMEKHKEETREARGLMWLEDPVPPENVQALL